MTHAALRPLTFSTVVDLQAEVQKRLKALRRSSDNGRKVHDVEEKFWESWNQEPLEPRTLEPRTLEPENPRTREP
jgi:hypothetical protein